MYTPKEMRLAALERLQLPKQLRIFIEEACLLLHHVDGAKFTSDSITSYEKIGEESLAIASTLNKEKTTSIANALEKWARCSSHLTAADLKQIGISTGPDIGLTLHRLKWADFIGTISSKTDAYNFLQNENIK